jgi:hypothetical protein
MRNDKVFRSRRLPTAAAGPTWRRATGAALVMAAAAMPAAAAVFDNGQVNEVDDAAGSSIVRDSMAGQATTLHLLDGGSTHRLGVEDTSIAILHSGSSSRQVVAGDESTLHIHGGAVEFVDATDQSSVTISGGTFTRGNNTLRVFHDAQVTITGGTFTVESSNMVIVQANGSVTIRDGTFIGGRIYVGGDPWSHATMEIHGGSFLEQAGEGLAQIINVYESVTTIHGRSFNLPFGAITEHFDGILRGVLANGDPIEVNLVNNVAGSDTGRVILVQSAVPEPSTWAMLLGGLAMTGWMARRQRRALRDVD